MQIAAAGSKQVLAEILEEALDAPGQSSPAVPPRPTGPNSSSPSAPTATPPATTSLSANTHAVYAGLAQLAMADMSELRDLTPSDVLKLSSILQLPLSARPEAGAVPTVDLFREAVSAVADDRFEQAIGYLASAVTTDPGRVEELRDQPAFTPIRANIDQLLNRVTQVAQLRAQTSLAQAEEAFDKAGWQKLPHWDAPPQVLLRLATQVFEAGGYANYVRSAELAQATMQSAYWESFIPQQQPLTRNQEALLDRELDTFPHYTDPLWTVVRAEVPVMIRTLWRRAPLLVLFFAWLTAGSAAGLVYALARIVAPSFRLAALGDAGFATWALGFLALVGIGFYAKIRLARNAPRNARD